MVLLNAQSLRNKIVEFKAMVASFEVDIIAITETWLDTGRRDFAGEYHLPGYTMFHSDRRMRAGGGVMLYARNHLIPVLVPNVSPFEVVGARLRGCEPALLVLVVYRPPKYNRDSDMALYEVLSGLLGGRSSIVVGDFNCPKVNWDLDAATGEGLRLVDFMHDNFLTQMVRHPTRGASILDLVFTTDTDLITEVEVGECLAGSDHHMVSCLVGVRSQPEVPLYRRRLNLRRADFGRFNQELQDLRLHARGSVEELWTDFKANFEGIQSTCIPLKRVGGFSKVNPRWFHGGIRREIKERKRLYHAANANPSPETNELLVAKRRQVKRLVRRAKADEEHRVALACRDNPKEFYGYVNSHKTRTPLGPVLDDNGTLVTSSGDIASAFNQYFSGVFTVEDIADIPEPVIVYDGEDMLTTIRCTVPEIVAKIGALHPNKAAGPDGFLPAVVKSVAESIAPHLCDIFNMSLSTGEVPLDMRSANVSPIHKKGPLIMTDNFRPVSLTCVPGKLLEAVVKGNTVEHVERNNLIGNSQHGFRKGRSCLTNLLEFYHVMFNTYDRSRAVDVLFLDFKKAFDKVPHKRLMLKVRALGIGGEVARWIESWLTDRRQRVVVNGVASEWTPVTSGVPQGSVLGPLLFTIYINDLDSGLLSKISKFADDTKLGINAADPKAILELRRDLQLIGEWSVKWQMPFNVDKCRVMHVGGGNPREEYTLLGSPIAESSRELDLGVLITENFKFSAQCIEAERRAQKILGYIKRMFRHPNKVTVLTLYNALVRPLLEYAVQFWSPTLQADIARLEKVQERATKLVPSVRLKGYERRRIELGLFTLEQRRLRGQLIETFKILRGVNEVDPTNYFTLSENPTRNHGWKVVPPRFNTSIFRDFMTVRVCNVWNSLPVVVVNAPSVESFKRRLDRILPDLHY